MSLGHIRWVTPFKAKDADISILKRTPLANPYHVGGHDAFVEGEVKTQEDVNTAYLYLIKYLISCKAPHVIAQLDMIAERVMDGQDVNLISMEEHTPHILAEFIYEQIREHIG